MVCHLQLLLTLSSAFILRSESRGNGDYILLSQIETSLFVASYNSQGYGGGIRTHLHTGTETGVRVSQSLFTTGLWTALVKIPTFILHHCGLHGFGKAAKT
jgi:hypothetical protein